MLAHAGLLDGRRATTHWRYADDLRRRYPLVEVDPNPLYVSDGPIHTSAGTAAGIDLCLALVAADFGVEVAAAVARRLVMPLHRAGGQAQYIDAPIEPPAAELLDWAREQLGEGIRVDDLATHAALSTRTLNRHFARHVGTTPGEWLARERLRLAQRLLERTADPVALVARKAGYASAATLRAQFAARLGTSPRAYRESFARPGHTILNWTRAPSSGGSWRARFARKSICSSAGTARMRTPSADSLKQNGG